MSVRLVHKDGETYGSRYGRVTVNYDGRTHDLDVTDGGAVHATNQQEAERLLENHGGFEEAEDASVEEDLEGYVLQDKTVNEIAEYVSEIDTTDRLTELRELERSHKNRTTAVDEIDNRIAEVRDTQD